VIREAMAAGSTRDEAAAAAGISRSQLERRLLDQLRDLRVGQGRRGRRRGPSVDPTPEEIRQRAALVRQTWTADRWGLRAPDPLDLDGRYGG
jgi:hypothetical protein